MNKQMRWLFVISSAVLVGACDSHSKAPPAASSASPVSSATAGPRTLGGTVTAVGAKRFIVEGTEVVYPDGLVDGLPSGPIEINQRVSVWGMHSAPDGAVIARSIIRYDALPSSTHAEAVVAGPMILDYDRIFMSGQRIDVSPGTSIEGRLTSGSYVRVTGISDGETLKAAHVLVLGTGPEFWHYGSVEDVDVVAGTLTAFGIEFDLNEWTQIRGERNSPLSLGDVAVGDRVNVMAYENGFVSGVYRERWVADARMDLIEGEYFRDLSPPLQFTLDGVRDTAMQVTPNARFSYDHLRVTPDMQGHSGWRCSPREVDAARFWELAAQPRPPDVAYVQAWGRFEGRMFMADGVALCRPGGLPP